MAAKNFFMPARPAFDTAGLTVPGAQAYFALSGTNTPSPAYADAALTTQLPNPVVANGAGRWPAIYLDGALEYRVRIFDRYATPPAGTPLEEYDPYIPGTIDGPFVAEQVDAAATSAALAGASAANAANSALDAEASATVAINNRVTRNLYDYTTNTLNKRLDITGIPQDNAGTQVSDFIPVAPTTQYSIARYEPIVGQAGHLKQGYGTEYAQYDASHNFIAGTWANTWPLTTHASAAFIRLGDVQDAVATQVQVQQGAATDGVFTPYSTFSEPATLFSRKFEGKTFAVLGDSISRDPISWWQELKLPMGFTNDPNADMLLNPGYAVAGRAVANRPTLPGNDEQGNPWSAGSFYQRRTIVDTTRDVVLLGPMGTNDWSSPYDSAFGTMTSRAPTTFYGALHLLCQYFVDTFPAKYIYLITMPPRVDAFLWTAYSGGTGGPTSTPALGALPTGYSVNNLGLTLDDYANAILEVGAFYGLPVIDVFHVSPLRVFDETERAANMGDHVHPTQFGQRLLGRQIVCEMAKLWTRP